MMKAPKVPDAPPPPPPPLSPTVFGGKKKPSTGATPIPTFLGSEAAPLGQPGTKTLLGQ
jgi:hypothetical protein